MQSTHTHTAIWYSKFYILAMYVQMLDKSDFFFDIFEIFENITLLSNPEHNSSLRQQNSFSFCGPNNPSNPSNCPNQSYQKSGCELEHVRSTTSITVVVVRADRTHQLLLPTTTLRWQFPDGRTWGSGRWCTYVSWVTSVIIAAVTASCPQTGAV